MTGGAIEKDSTSRQNDFSEWTHKSVPYKKNLKKFLTTFYNFLFLAI